MPRSMAALACILSRPWPGLASTSTPSRRPSSWSAWLMGVSSVRAVSGGNAVVDGPAAPPRQRIVEPFGLRPFDSSLRTSRSTPLAWKMRSGRGPESPSSRPPRARGMGGRRSSSATRGKPTPPGITSCAQGASPGLVGLTSGTRFSHVWLRRLLQPTLLAQGAATEFMRLLRVLADANNGLSRAPSQTPRARSHALERRQARRQAQCQLEAPPFRALFGPGQGHRPSASLS